MVGHTDRKKQMKNGGVDAYNPLQVAHCPPEAEAEKTAEWRCQRVQTLRLFPEPRGKLLKLAHDTISF